MAGKRENRRVQMTKRQMKEALLELLEERELVNISVTAICEAADVHRSTFYKYYKDPGDLLRDIEQDYLDRTPTPSQYMGLWDEEQLLAETTAFFDDVKRSEKAYRILLGENTSSNFAARLIGLLCSGYDVSVEGGDEEATHYARLYIANGTVGMLREWVSTGFPVSSREIAEMMFRFSVRVTG